MQMTPLAKIPWLRKGRIFPTKTNKKKKREKKTGRRRERGRLTRSPTLLIYRRGEESMQVTSSLTLTSQIFLCPVHSRSPAFYIYTRSDRPRRICKDTDVCDHWNKKKEYVLANVDWFNSCCGHVSSIRSPFFSFF